MNLLARIAQWYGIKSRRQSAAPLAGLPAIPQCPAWTVHDRDWWLAVLNNERGRKMLARTRAVECALAIKNAQDTFHTQHSAGVSAGFGQAITYLLSLASSGEQEQQKDSEGNQDPHDELLARLSP